MDAEATTRKQKHVAEEYLSSLSDLQCNSKPLINMLTMLAEENIDHAPIIVKVVEQHIAKVPTDLKLPILYLIDSIVKNVKSSYVTLFGQCIVNIFCGVFEKVNEKVRERMYALRQTWNEVFPASKLYNLDVRVKQMDKNWPITAIKQQPTAIHVNPNFLKSVPNSTLTTDVEELLQAKTRELLELKKRKLELELEATKKHLEEQQKQLSKSTESGVVPPILDPLIDPNILNSSTKLPQILPSSNVPATHVNPALLAGQQQMPPAIMPTANNVYNQNYVRPTPRVALPQQKGSMPLVQPMNTGAAAQQNLNKIKVHPVNPALLNSIRHRDPRLMRQQQQQQQLQQQANQSLAENILIPPSRVSPSTTTADDAKRDRRESSKSSKSSRFNSGMEGNSKSATRHSSFNRSSHRPSKSSSSNSSSSRDKNRERKRNNEGKSNSNSSDRRYQKTGSSSSSASSSKHSSASKTDKDANEDVDPTSTMVASNSHRSPSSSPTKLKDSYKRNYINKTTSNNNKNGSARRSNSPEDIVSSTKDLDLRAISAADSSEKDLITTTESNKKAAIKGLEQNIINDLDPMASSMATKSPTKQDVDLRQLLVSDNTNPSISQTTLSVSKISLQNVVPVEVVKTATLDRSANLGFDVDKKTPVVVASSSSTKSPTLPKVSFKIQKSFNKLAKSTEPLSTAITTKTPTNLPLLPSSSSASSSTGVIAKTDTDESAKKLTSKVGSSNEMDIDEPFVSRPITVDGKKRVSESGNNDEPMAKKSKATKMDTLFGSEDVDLRTLAPSIMTKPIENDILTPPPPPSITLSDDEQQQEVGKSRESHKTSRVSAQNASSQRLPSNFDDVRARLAKATKLSKLEKTAEKTRQKLSEVNTNEDETTQEVDEERIRMILSQAQEMSEFNSINQDQLKQLVQTVINEKNKLKEAKRRESLQQQNASKVLKDVTASPKDDDNIGAVDAELMAARDAVLRKRIPKISKSGTTNSSDNSVREQPKNDEKKDSRDSDLGLNKLKPKEKRVRHSKWGDRNDSQLNSNSSSQRTAWLAGSTSKRANIGMRDGPIPPPPQAPQPPMILGPNAMRPIHGAGWPQSGNNNQTMPIPFGNQMPLIRSSVPPPPQPPISIPTVLPTITPNALPKPCNSIDNPQAELVRTITIDGQSKDIRIYDDVAIVFMELDQPREIGFQPGQRAIIIDNQEPVTLRFNDDYRPLMIAGEQHRVRFGFPSRELYIDDHWYEIYFGGPPVSIPINNRIHVLKAEGPPPQVNIGPLRRDLVVGKIHMIVEATNMFPLFLDSRIQTFRLNDREHTVQFADNLLTILLDGQPVQVEYGGLPKAYNLSGKRYFIRFTTLPNGVVAGKVEIKDMIFIKTEPPKKVELPLFGIANEEKPAITDVKEESVKNEEKLVPVGEVNVPVSTSIAPSIPAISTTALGKINIDELFQKLVSTGILNTTVTTGAIVNSTVGVQDNKVAKTEIPVETKTEENPPEKDAEEKLPPIIPIDLRKPESIKMRQEAIISMLYSGMQCSSCGVRFPPEQTIKYSQHLDWHFRQNRRERDSTRKAHSRKWYYELNDWLQYEEIEDLEEREKNFFETQQSDLDAIEDVSNQRSTNSPLPSCPAGPDDVDRVCDMCQEKFEQFYNEELEEWHLRAALRVEDKIYHPLCYEDYKASLNPPSDFEKDIILKSNDEDVIMHENDNAVDAVIKIEDEKCSEEEITKPAEVVDDDDDVIVLPNEEPSVTEIDDDDEEYVPINVTREEMSSSQKDKSDTEDKDESAMESDVEIQEPNIPFTDLDTYEEKELPTMDENSQASFLNVKIKEEPKDDEEEDDGFEDVGTVMYGPHDEISIQSSEETQTQTILSSTDSPLTLGGERSSSANIFSQAQTDETPVAQPTSEIEEITDDSTHLSIDGNLEPADGHNLTAGGPPPAVPLGSLVNRIKINITKNTSAASTNTTASSTVSSVEDATVVTTSTATVTSTTMTEDSSNSNLNRNNSNSYTKPCNINTITNVVSSIPVLCAGGTMPSSNLASSNNVSNITVIGSYANYQKPHHHHHQQQSLPVLTTPVNTTVVTTNPTITGTNRQRTPSPVVAAPVEETITYEQKPALQKANLKKMKKIECGVETSGLCSIM